MHVFYEPPFRRFVKKQKRSFQLAIEDETEKIQNNPFLGEAKKGDLSGFRVFKFKFQQTEYLMAYKFLNTEIIFYMIGTHENFYHELKQYLKEVER